MDLSVNQRLERFLFEKKISQGRTSYSVRIKGKATGKQLDKLPGSYPRQALAVYHP